jgi:hypothetical protein
MGKAWVAGSREPPVSAVTWGFGAPRGNRTPNPLIPVAGFATTLNNTSTAALSSMYSSRSMN